jgi:hypothetical protein
MIVYVPDPVPEVITEQEVVSGPEFVPEVTEVDGGDTPAVPE